MGVQHIELRPSSPQPPAGYLVILSRRTKVREQYPGAAFVHCPQAVKALGRLHRNRVFQLIELVEGLKGPVGFGLDAASGQK